MKKVTTVRSVKKPVATKRKLDLRKDCGTQTDRDEDDINLVIGDEPPLKYWKLLAEKRQKIVEELTEENEKLIEKAELLESENRILESMLEDAKVLAEFVSGLPDDPDESGIEKDADEDDGGCRR